MVAEVGRCPGILPDLLGSRVGLSPRHTGYYASAGILLGLLRPRPDGGFELTTFATSLLQTRAGTRREREFWTTAIRRSPIGLDLAPDLLSEPAPDRRALAKRIADYAGLSLATAQRRADCLLSWRTQVGEPARGHAR